MKIILKLFYLIFMLFIADSIFQAQGHFPSLTIPSTGLGSIPSGYTAFPVQRQNKAITNSASLATLGTQQMEIFAYVNEDTTGWTWYLVYTTNGTAPSKSNGTVVNMTFAVYNDPARIWRGTIPSQASPINIRYVIYANTAGTNLSGANRRIASETLGVQTSWAAEGDNFYSTGLIAPGGVAAPDFWVKSDDAGTIATAWKDQSANNNPIENVGGMTLSAADQSHNFYPFTTGYTAAKLFRDNNNSIAFYNGSGTALLWSDLNARSSSSIFSAVRATTISDGRIVGIDDTSTEASLTQMSLKNGKPSDYWWYTTGNTDHPNTVSANVSSVISGVQSRNSASAPGGEVRIGLDGTYATEVKSTADFLLAGQYLNIGYGSCCSGIGAFPGDIMEVIWYKRALSQNEQSRVNTYLALKNGTTSAENYLSSGSVTIWNITANAGYNKNIAGIGKDDVSGLYQKQSNSVNADKQVLIGLPGMANTNAGNTGTLTDGQYLIWGDNGLLKNLSVIINGVSGANYRFGSIWKVQNTKSVGTVRVMWPVGLTNLKLVQSSDPIFDGTDSITDMSANTQTINGITYNYADVTFTDGQYFTFAGFKNAPGGVINGLTLWYDAATSATLSNWTSREGNNFVISKNGTGPLSIINGDATSNFNPYYNFPSGSTDAARAHFTGLLTGSLSPSSLGRFHTTFAAGAKSQSIDASYNHIVRFGSIAGNTSAHTFGLGMNNINNNPTLHYITNSPTVDRSYAVNVPLDKMTLIGGQINSLSGTNTKAVGYNGDYQLFSSSTTLDNITGDLSPNFQIGGSTYGFAGKVPEVVYYNVTLTNTERDQVNTYLGIKYGVTLRSGDAVTGSFNYLNSLSTIVWNGSTSNNAYHNNVAGIARDDFASQYQKQSMSINSGQQVLIGLPGMANTNAANTGTLTDGQYLIWGDNGLVKNLSVIINGISGANYRFGSIWKVQNTNSVGTVRVMWPVGLTNLKLVQSTDTVFDGTDSVTDMSANTQTINGITYNYADVTFTDGQYFTFAAYGIAPGGVINGLTLWYDATTTATPTNWTSKEGNNFVISKNGTGPLSIINGDTTSNFNPYYNFPSGSTDATRAHFTGVLTGSLSPSSLGRFHTTFAAGAKSQSIDASYNHIVRFGSIAGNASAHTFGLGLNTSNNNPTLHYISNSSTVDRSYAISTPLDKMTLIGGQINSLSGANAKSTGYNGDYQSFTDNITGDLSPNFQIGGSIYGFAGKVPEVVYYNVTLTNTERDQVNTYLGIKYGVTLRSGDAVTGSFNYLNSLSTIVWNGNTSNSAYHNNVAGIARDDFASQYQKQSMSINSGQQVLIGLPGMANTNAANTGTLTDGQYLIWGDNGLARTATTAVSGLSGVTSRFPAIWKVQNTNSVGTVRVMWPVGLANLKLVQSSDAIIGLGDIVTDMSVNTQTINGITYNYADVTLTDGQYFTFGIASFCTKDPNLSAPANVFTKLGITTQTKQSGWPDNLPNGFIALESKNKGMVLTRTVSSAITNPVEGMLIYDTSDNCIKLYNGTSWNCVVRSCNQ